MTNFAALLACIYVTASYTVVFVCAVYLFAVLEGLIKRQAFSPCDIALAFIALAVFIADIALLVCR